MKFQMLAIGAVLGFIIAVAPSCGGTKCGPNNCSGCCTAAGVCTTTPANGLNTTCGKAGNLCTDCSATGQTCSADFACTGTGAGGGGAGGGSAGGCNAQNCLTGCCNNGVCVPQNSQIASSCGKGGAVCSACGSGQSCVAGSCVTPDAGPMSDVGKACNQASDCSALGTGAVCRKNTTLGNGTYTDGYCTKQCNNQSNPCPTGSNCINTGLGLGEDNPICLSQCNPMADNCRAGYACYALNQAQTIGACYLDENTLPTYIDAGRPADKIGAACTASTDCRNPPDAPFDRLAFCTPQTLPDAGLTGYTGGYCSADCSDFGNALCGNGSQCVAIDAQGNAFCYATCSAPWAGQSNCRAGYACNGLVQADGGPAPTGYCEASCLAPGAGCGTGGYCDAGYCLAQ